MLNNYIIAKYWINQMGGNKEMFLFCDLSVFNKSNS